MQAPTSTSIDFFPTEYSATTDVPTGTFPGYAAPNTYNASSNMGFGSVNEYEDEPPLWEELGLDPDFIKRKAIALLIPGKNAQVDESLLNDGDLGGPFIFCVLLGLALLLQGGKLHFGYIFGYNILGSLVMYILLNLMCEHNVGFYQIMSVLGYCLAPMILLAIATLVAPPTSIVGLAVGVLTIGYCTHSASVMFVSMMGTTDQRFLFAYP
eukprot:CAMPEP_0168562000 /NCGR_PEP_ID=MMETSP0413-20121227/11892_1 /TAXON_ID=136452 /ORGANISM="Filamoeba nolandi, Strain NC-AS-23-1" /LENGTH=210 /DNA_ID=CAMNT_0008593403 /DNA_START=61 /DNA_END=689 /DNA_ORIENTATION=+